MLLWLYTILDCPSTNIWPATLFYYVYNKHPNLFTVISDYNVKLLNLHKTWYLMA